MLALALCILLFMYPGVAPTHTLTRYISMRTWPPLWDNRLVKCRLCGGRKGMGVPCLRNNEQNNNAAGLFCVDSVSSFPRWNDSECCWVDSADEPLSDLLLRWEASCLQTWLHCSLLWHRITNHWPPVHLPRFFACQYSTWKKRAHRHTVVPCFPLLLVWLHAASLVQPVFEHVIQTGRYGSCRLGQVRGQLLPPLCAPNLSLSPGCVMRLLGHNWKTLHPSRPRQTLRKLSDVI